MGEDLNAIGAYCPRCGTEYRPGFSVCADDGTELVTGPKPTTAPEPVMAPEPATPATKWVVVATFSVEERARLLAGRLEADGIPARVYPEWTGDYYGQATNRVVGRSIEVLVPEDRAEDARAVIDEIEGT